ncbi:MAG: CPBP family intramembrane metalloprotease, partial [Eubacterium sp.]|nr:CPBP family intramembrane metalloprotease [Eubacterium sp.]
NFLSIGAIVAYLVATLKELHVAGTDFSIGSFVPAILISILCVACFALFMSAVVMCVCAFAKSFKEANNYITPIALVVLMISYVGFVPSIELNRITAMIPVANISLLIKNLLVFKYDFSMIILVLCSNVAYALLAIGVLSRIYHSEALLFGDSALGITLFERRKNIQKGAMPSIQDGLFVIVITFLLVVYLGGILSLKMPILGIFVPQACMMLIPLMVCWYTKGKVGKIFSLKMPKIRELLASLVLYIGVGSLSMVMSEGLSRFFPGEAESVGYTYGQVLGDVPFPVALLVIAVLPAICEEMMFRGYLLTSFSGKMKAFPAMLLVAGLFACSHMSLIKLLPTFVLGMALCYAVYQTKSIVCSALMHFLNNALSVGILYYGDMISWLQDETMANKVIIDLFIIAVLCIPMGIMLLRERRFYAKIS